jgi:hypothetical protein
MEENMVLRNLRIRLSCHHLYKILFIDIQTWKSVRLLDCMFWFYFLLRMPFWAKRFAKARFAPHE